MGARYIILLDLPPLGCLPAQISLHGKGKPGCVQEINDVAVKFNQVLQAKVNSLKLELHGGRLLYLDTYNPLSSYVHDPNQYGKDLYSLNACWLMGLTAQLTETGLVIVQVLMRQGMDVVVVGCLRQPFYATWPQLEHAKMHIHMCGGTASIPPLMHIAYLQRICGTRLGHNCWLQRCLKHTTLLLKVL